MFSGVASIGARIAPLDNEKIVKNWEKVGKNQEKERKYQEKIEKKRKKQEEKAKIRKVLSLRPS